MFGIGFQEMLIILVVVLIFFGPKRLPDLAKSLGKGIAEFKKASDEVRQGINEAMKEDAPPAGSAPEGVAAPAPYPVAEEGQAAAPPPGDKAPPADPEPPAASGPTAERRDS